MTEQELIDGIQQIGFSSASEWTANVVSIAKSYADARVAQECKVLDETVALLHQTIANRNVAIAELKAENKTLDNRCSRLANIANQHRSAATAHFIHNLALKGDVIPKLNAEIKRLRDFANQCQKSPEKLVKMNWFEDGSFDYCDLVPLQEAAASVLSPVPVTETTTDFQFKNRPQDTSNILPKNEDQE